MVGRIGRSALAAVGGLALAVIAGVAAQGQDTAAPPRPPSATIPTAIPPGPSTPASPATARAQPSPATPGPDAADSGAAPTADAPETEEEPAKRRAPAPVGPQPPRRAPAAVLRVLDKITAETMAFEAPVGRRVRFKTLVFEVKACEYRDPGVPGPQPSAYVVVTSDVGAPTSILSSRQIFRGWMFADAPGVHAMTHPVYDVWLVACTATAPAT